MLLLPELLHDVYMMYIHLSIFLNDFIDFFFIFFVCWLHLKEIKLLYNFCYMLCLKHYKNVVLNKSIKYNHKIHHNNNDNNNNIDDEDNNSCINSRNDPSFLGFIMCCFLYFIHDSASVEQKFYLVALSTLNACK